MTIKKNRVYSVITLLLFSNFGFAQQLDIDEFLRAVLKHNPGVQRILIANAVASGELEASMGVDDAVLNSSMGLSRTEPNQIQGFEPSRTDDALLNLSYDQLYSQTGSRVTLAYGNQFTDRNPSITGLGTTYFQPSFTLRLTQPLLKNAGGIQDRLNIELSQLNLRLTRLNSLESLESYITQLATLYIDWHLASRELEIAKDVYQQSIKQEKLTEEKVKRQVVESYELLRAQETREDYFSRWQQALGRFNGLTKQIRLQMNSDEDTVDELLPHNPKQAQLFATKPTNNNEADYLSTRSRLKGILDSLATQQDMLLEARQDAQSSDLNLSLAYSRHGVGDEFSDAHGTDLEKDDYSIMLEYKRPFGNRKASGNYQVQRANKQRTEADIRQRLIDAEARLANLQSQMSKLIVALQSIDRKIDLAAKKIKKEQKLFEIGQIDLFELLRDQTTQMESRLNREKLNAQLLALRLDIGELLDNNLAVYSASLNSEIDADTSR